MRTICAVTVTLVLTLTACGDSDDSGSDADDPGGLGGDRRDTVRGSATFVRQNSVFGGREPETATGTFEATCGEERLS